MKIVKEKNLIKFEKLACGEVFKDKGENNYCVKTEESAHSNVVHLLDGRLSWVDDKDFVERVDCELVIK